MWLHFVSNWAGKIGEFKMKDLADGTRVVARMYYYLLDFNDMTRWEYIINVLQKNALRELNKAEFMQLFQHATTVDLERYK